MVAEDLENVKGSSKMYHHAVTKELHEFQNAVILGLRRSTSSQEKQWE
jgi:hypothetical protein